jgi:hypothetical protein
MYLLNIKPLTSLGCPLNAVFHDLSGPMPQDAETPLLSLQQMFNLSIISIAVLKSVSPTQDYIKDPTFSTLIAGPAGTGDQTQATCLADSGTSCSAIHYGRNGSTEHG